MIPHRVPPVLRLGPARLTAGLDHTRRLDLPAHRTVHGTPPTLDLEQLIAMADEVDLRGRGGAHFPFARKLRAVAEAARARESVVLVNATEGEPASSKDAMLLVRTPHLVIDGALLAADALRAREVVIAVPEDSVSHASVTAAVEERRAAAVAGAAESRLRVRVVGLPERFITGEGGALVRGVNGLAAVPPGRKRRAAVEGVDGLPTLLSNAETFAQAAVLAELGPATYAGVGTAREPGTLLLTVGGTAVVEAAVGMPLTSVLDLCGAELGEGVLIGGYHGAWLDARTAAGVELSREGVALAGGTLGAGIIVPVGESTCPLGELARVTAYLAGQSSGQCGPCRLGLPEAARAVSGLCSGQGSVDAVRRAVRAVERRGACFHPDGTARFVLSALEVFADHVTTHLEHGPCGRPVRGVLPLPEAEAEPSYHLDIDWTRCEGHGLCAHLLPEFVDLDAFGYPSFREIPGWMVKDARRAVEMCPALALRLADTG
ncbi:NADH-quinone oxidoreductase subunit NuoF family protein [Thermoactinospora rubra]|uniref:NADH-quinone oxidoreductase subunit NuoF family protein n=1 Tax=Thermoactinospora rubra TaxID=1088767 RepID=UPI000A121F6E|nr:NADH-quinone oxidoreductase subunit NuoF family protein [Thermoactinospora rubra]